MSKKAIIFVMDGVGIGEMPDAALFGDTGANTYGSVWKAYENKLNIPNLISLGIGNIRGSVLPPVQKPKASFGKCAEKFCGKDTTGGHWEIAGLIPERPFQVFPEGFSADIISDLKNACGRGFIGNKPASGTEIIKELGKEHVETGNLIIYTSADSVMQIAAHESIIPLDELYRICGRAREIMQGDRLVCRVIARPFEGSEGSYARTENRRDFSIEPTGKTVLDLISGSGFQVASVGKIDEIFCMKGITLHNHTKNNMASFEATLDYIAMDFDGLIFTNLIDYDMLYGHRRDVIGFGKSLEEMDKRLPELLSALGRDDILMITADHGNDPSFHGTDHTREYVPVLVYGEKIKKGIDLGVRDSFADIGASVMEWLGLPDVLAGSSFMGLLR